MASAVASRGLQANPSLPAKVQPIPPNQTYASFLTFSRLPPYQFELTKFCASLYVTNLPSAKVKKPDLRTALYLLFSAYGPVLDIVVLKTMKMRGQAHIVYRDIQTATQAMRALNGSEFLGLAMVRRSLSVRYSQANRLLQKIDYAKSKSHFVSKLDGTFKMPTSTGAAEVEVTDLQSSIFNAPAPGTAAASRTSALPARPSAADSAEEKEGSSEGRGQKRPRDEESEEESDGDVAMEEDSDDED
jgi:U2 small nuclear ribonucleoprotein B''